jgi:hypothetical protein
MNRMGRFSVGALLAAAVAAPTPALRKGVSVEMPVTMNAVAMPDADLADSVVVAVTLRGALFLEVTAVTPARGRNRARRSWTPGSPSRGPVNPYNHGPGGGVASDVR